MRRIPRVGDNRGQDDLPPTWLQYVIGVFVLAGLWAFTVLFLSGGFVGGAR